MNFTKTLPTRPGFYAWRFNEVEPEPSACVVFKKDVNLFVLITDDIGAEPIEDVGGEWCELVPRDEVVPKGEVEKAYDEGLKDFNSNSSWTYSRAKRVMEGKE
jgi:hypothetical protein